MIQVYYPNIHIVKGRPRHPQTQGKIERRHATFKENLQKWIDRTQNKNWLLGAYIVNAEMNQIPQWNCGGFSPYNLYYGMDNSQKAILNFGQITAKTAITEYGVIGAKLFCLQAQKLCPEKLVVEEELVHVIKKGKSLQILDSNFSVLFNFYLFP